MATVVVVVVMVEEVWQGLAGLPGASVTDEAAWPDHRAWMLDRLARLLAAVSDAGEIIG